MSRMTATKIKFATERERRAYFDAQMRASNAIEGLHASPAEDALFTRINAPGVSDEEAARLFDEYCRNLLTTSSDSAE